MQGWRKGRNIGVAGPSKCLKYWYGRWWQIVVHISNIGMAAAIHCHQVPPPLSPIFLFKIQIEHSAILYYLRRKRNNAIFAKSSQVIN